MGAPSRVEAGYTPFIRRLGSRSVLGLLGLSAVLGCGDRAPEVVVWPESELELGFVVSVRAGRFERIFGPFSFADASAPPLRLDVEDDVELLLVGFTAASLRRIHPRIDSERLLETRLDLESAECPTGSLVGEDRLRVGLEHALGVVMELTPGGAWRRAETRPLLSSLSLSLPYADHLPCRPAEVRLTPFSRSERSLEPGTVIDGAPRTPEDPREAGRYFHIGAMAWLAHDRVATGSVARLYLLRRGGVFEDDERHHIRLGPFLPSITRGSWALNGMRRDPTFTESGRSKLWATLRVEGAPVDARVHGALLEIVVSDAGLESVRTASVSAFALTSIEFETSGAFAIGGEEPDQGPVLLFGIRPGVVEQVVKAPGFPGAFDLIRSTGSPELPFVVAADLHVFGVSRVGPEAVQLELWTKDQFISVIRSLAVRATEHGVECWAGTYSSGLFRRHADGRWEPVLAALPNYASACAGTNLRCGWRTLENVVLSMGQLGDGRLGMGTESCDALIVFDPEASCFDVVTVNGAPIGRSSFNRLTVHAEGPTGTLFGGADSTLRVAEVLAP